MTINAEEKEEQEGERCLFLLRKRRKRRKRKSFMFKVWGVFFVGLFRYCWLVGSFLLLSH